MLFRSAPVAKDLMTRAGFNVDMQSMDWQTLVARRVKKDPPSAGGWNAAMTSWVAADILNPVMTGFLNASCDSANWGWPCDQQMEKLRDDFARETDPARQKAIAEQVQARAFEIMTHIPLGQWYQPGAIRKGVVEDLKYPWFNSALNKISDEIVDMDSEDVAFCKALWDAGHPVYVDTKIRVGHQKLMAI